MTIPHWGRITPSQGYILMLAGHVISGLQPEFGAVEPDERRLDAMRAGYAGLCRLTGRDHGYDLAKWHQALMAGNDEFGYRHPYAWRTVRKAIETDINDSDRMRLVRLLGEWECR